jgi:hypothetical protein
MGGIFSGNMKWWLNRPNSLLCMYVVALLMKTLDGVIVPSGHQWIGFSCLTRISWSFGVEFLCH